MGHLTLMWFVRRTVHLRVPTHGTMPHHAHHRGGTLTSLQQETHYLPRGTSHTKDILIFIV